MLWLYKIYVFSLIIFSSFIVRKYVIHITYKICVNRLFMVSVRLPVNRRLLIVKFWGSQKLYRVFAWGWGWSPPLTSCCSMSAVLVRFLNPLVLYFNVQECPRYLNILFLKITFLHKIQHVSKNVVNENCLL